MNWNPLQTEADVEALLAESEQHPVLVFKHSTRCSISNTALNRLDRKWQAADNAQVKPYLIDLLNYRPASNRVASLLAVEHQSPQAVVLHKGQVLYVANHLEIRYEDILAATEAA